MAITDAERHRLHNKLDEVLGEEDAGVLISHLPPSGWSDVARTRDLDHLEERIGHRFDAVDTRFEAIDKRFDDLEDRWRSDERFETMQARFDATIERCLREQTHRFLAYLGAVTAISLTIQGIVAALVAG